MGGGKDGVDLNDYPKKGWVEGGNSTRVTVREGKSWNDRDNDTGSEESISPLHCMGGIVRKTEFIVKQTSFTVGSLNFLGCKLCMF